MILKIWKGKYSDTDYYYLLNEIEIYYIFHKTLNRVKRKLLNEIKGISIPKVLLFERSQYRILFGPEFVKGFPGSRLRDFEKIKIYRKLIALLNFMENNISEKERKLISKRSVLDLVLLYPLTVLTAIIFHLENVLIRGKTIFLIDLASVCLGDPMIDWITTLKHEWMEGGLYKDLLKEIHLVFKNKFLKLKTLMVIDVTHGLATKEFPENKIELYENFLRMVLDQLISSLSLKEEYGICAGNSVPLPPETFIEKAVFRTVNVYHKIRKEINSGRNILSVSGTLLALKKDVYFYYKALSLGFKFQFCKNAIVYYRLPQNLADHIKQNCRFLASPYKSMEHFNQELVDRESFIPRRILFKHVMTEFIESPLHCSLIWMVNLYCAVLAKMSFTNFDNHWDLSRSTKNLATRGGSL